MLNLIVSVILITLLIPLILILGVFVKKADLEFITFILMIGIFNGS